MITTHLSSTDGTVYLHTHHGESSAQIADALSPYIGRDMKADLPNNYGHYARYRVRLEAVDGERVTVLATTRDGRKHRTTVDAFDAFGTNCTTIEPVREGADR